MWVSQGGADGADAVRGLAHDHVALELEQPACGGPEARVVVDDENACSHTESLRVHTRFTKADTQ
jgi:hypothetical protein